MVEPQQTTPTPVVPVQSPLPAAAAPAPQGAPAAAAKPAPAARALTFRSVVAALLVSALTLLIATYHDGQITQADTTLHDYIFPLATGLSFVLLALLNGAVRWIHRGLGLSPGELAVAFALVLVAAPLSRHYTNSYVGTIGYMPELLEAKHRTVSDLNKLNVYDALPEGALLSVEDSRQFDKGLSARPGDLASPAQVPWRVWVRPLLYWAPLMLCFLGLTLSLGYTLYRQWACRELVPFPLAEIMASMVRNERGRAFPDIFYLRSFWLGVGIIVFIFGCNGLHAHFEKMIEVPTKFSYYNLSQTFPFLKHSQEGYSLLRGTMYFSVIAIVVLLPMDISLTAAVTWPMMVVFTYLFYVQTGNNWSGKEQGPMTTGAAWAIALVVLYGGRTFYLALLRRAFGRPSKTEVDRQSLWVFRIFLFCALLLVVLLWLYGVPLDLAVLYTLCSVVFFLVVCRLVTEMGIPWTPLNNLGPLPLFLATLGEKALSAKGYALLAIFGSLTTPTHPATMLLAPAALNSAHVEARLTGGNASLKVVPLFLLVVLMMCLGAGIWLGYSAEGEANDYPSRRAVNEVTAAAKSIRVNFSDAAGKPLAPDQAKALLQTDVPLAQRFAAIRFDPKFLPYFLFGSVLVLITAGLRLKFPKFPLHPLPLVLLGSWLMSRFWFSFVLGYLIKKAIVQTGGGRLFEKCRPFFTGIVVGQALIFTVWVLVNIVVFCNHNFTFDRNWWLFFSDMYSI